MDQGMRRAAESAAERTLILRAQTGDHDAFAELFRGYRGAVFSVCMQHLRDTAAAEDALQETFLRAWKSLHSFDPQRRFYSWLVAIAVRCCINIAERTRSQIDLHNLEDKLFANASDEASAVVEGLRVREALARLPERYRQAVVLHDVAGYSCAEVAQTQATSEHAVRMTLSRARARLRVWLRSLWPAGLGLRRLWRRTIGEAERLSASPVGVWSASQVFSISFFVILLASSSMGVSLVGGNSKSSYLSAYQSAPAPHRSLLALQGFDNTSQGPSPKDAVRISTQTKPRRPGAIAAPDSTLALEVVGPDGRVVWRDQTSFRCDHVGDATAYTPSESPVRAVC